MKDVGLDVFDKYYLMMAIENHIMDLIDKKRGPSNNDKIDIQVSIWKKLLNIVNTQEISKEKHRYIFDVDSIGEVNDGSHSFNDLYWHRMVLFAYICNSNRERAWKSKLHHDGTMYDDYFIVGIQTPEGQFTYHYHIDWWDKFDVPHHLRAPQWDGHTSEDVVRLLSLLNMDKKEEDE